MSWAAVSIWTPAKILGGLMNITIGRMAAVLLLTISSISASAYQSGTPEGALEEMATANDFDTLLKHLPVKVQSSLEKLPIATKESILGRLLVRKSIESVGGQLNKSADGRGLELVNREGQLIAAVRVRNTFTSGSDALVEVEMKERSPKWEVAMIEMHYESGDWRVVKTGSWHGADVETEFMPQVERATEPNEAAAASTLRTLNTALVTYSATYSDVGYPADLQALSGSEDQESSRDHARLVDQSFMESSPIKYGYEFRYTATDGRHYQITATPVQMGKGKRSLFTDETCVLRVTNQSRPANAGDPPLE
jgi:hypothetical protein